MEKIAGKNVTFTTKVREILRITIFLLSFFPLCLYSQNIIDDEETKQYLSLILKPIFSVAKIPFDSQKIYIIEDDSLNAFVADGNDMFINTGTIIKAKNSNELSGVLAHEIGHIKGGHILRQKIRLEKLQKLSLASLIVAGAAGMASGRGDVATAIMLGGASSAYANMSAYQVEEERSADEAAVNFLNQIHQSPKGLADFMKQINIQNRLQGIEEFPYFRTHPVTAERISFLNNATKNSQYSTYSNLDKKHARVRAKLQGFLYNTAYVAKRYPKTDKSIEALYANCIADLRNFSYAEAMSKINILQQKEPDNPHFMELKGQILMEQGKTLDAKQEFMKALNVIPDSALFKYNVAQAILESEHNNKDLLYNEKILNEALQKQPSAYGWILLAKTYDELDKKAERQYATAQYSLEINMPEIAQKQLNDAEKYNVNSRLKLKIDDLQAEIMEALANK